MTFAVALSGGLLAAAALGAYGLRQSPRTEPRTALTVRKALLAAAAALSGAVLASGYAVPVPTDAADSVQVAIVQGNVQQPGMHFLGRPMKILDNHVKATLKLAADIKAGKVPKPDLVIWPENSSDLDPFTYPEAYEKITGAVQAIGVPVLVGALVDGPDAKHVQNEGIVWDPVTGPGASYTKQHPVPFGEYVPFRAELTKVIEAKLDQIPRDFYMGKSTGVLKIMRREAGRRDLLRGGLRRDRARHRQRRLPAPWSCRPTTPPTAAPASPSSSSPCTGCGPSSTAAPWSPPRPAGSAR